jgi:hypothetical protein
MFSVEIKLKYMIKKKSYIIAHIHTNTHTHTPVNQKKTPKYRMKLKQSTAQMQR